MKALFFALLFSAISSAAGPYHSDENLNAKIEKIQRLAEAPENDSSMKIESTVSEIFQTCKLAPAADAALHPILGKILEGARDLKEGKAARGRAKIHNALENYKKTFTSK